MLRDQHLDEFLLARALFGHLTSLATRPISQGNEIALHEAWQAVDDILAQLASGQTHGLVPLREVEVIRSLFGTADSVPLQLIANTFVRSLNQHLQELEGPAVEWPVYNCTPFVPVTPIRRLVVAVGPTIGLGDELIMARALTARTAETEVALHVETSRIALWRCCDESVEHLGAPPLAAAHWLTRLEKEQARQTGYVYADFLGSDPTSPPAHVPPNAGFCARWVFGDASSVIVVPTTSAVYRARYPDGLAVYRMMEADWMAARLLPAPATAPRRIAGVRQRSEPAKVGVLVQVLTSKPRLILPPTFYGAVFREWRHLTRSDLKVQVLAGPTDRAQAITDAVTDELSSVLRPGQVERLPRMRLEDVVHLVAEARAVVGPDTFTAHLAAAFEVPQVTLYLPKHRAWLNPAAPAFYVAPQAGLHQMARTVGHRLALLLHPLAERDVAEPSVMALTDHARRWAAGLHDLHSTLRTHLQGEPETGWSDTLRAAQELRDVACATLSALQHMLPDVETTLPPLHARRFPDKDDAVCALTRWHHAVGTSDLSGLLFSLAGHSWSITSETPSVST